MTANDTSRPKTARARSPTAAIDRASGIGPAAPEVQQKAPNIEQLLQQAVALHNAGELQQAGELYRAILDANPNHTKANHNLGTLAVRMQQPAAGLPFLEAALNAEPTCAQFWISYIDALIQSGQLDDARQTLEYALQNGLGGEEVNELSERLAAPISQQAASRQGAPEKIEIDTLAYNNLANLLQEHGRLDEAEEAYRNALAIRPQYVEALYNLALLLQERGRIEEAEAAYRQVVAICPQFAHAHNNLGIVLQEQGRLEDAEATYRQALTIDPQYANAHNNLGLLLMENGRIEEAKAACRQALTIDPQYADAHNNLGLLLKKEGRLAEAEAAYRQALAIRPNYPDAYNNLGLLLHATGRLDEAEAVFRYALALRPNWPEVRWNLGLLLLFLGRFAEGWALYEARYDPVRKKRDVSLPSLPFPQWQGESLTGKSLLIVPEQGYGDQIQFCRYVAELKKHGATRIDISCSGSLAVLFETIKGIDAVVSSAANTKVLDRYDYWTFPLSIPLHLKSSLDTIPAHLPYLHASSERVNQWTARLPQGKFRTGLVWKGRETHKNDANRSLPGLRTLAPLWSAPDVAFVSLQKGADEQTTIQDQPLAQFGSAITDFADTAAIVSQLDLVICVDTSVAHLAGALGKPCWVLLPCIDTDWRWLRERADSPWYPGVMRLFRQTRPGDWTDAVDQVASCLRRLASGDHSMLTPPTQHGGSETERRKLVIARQETDIDRWLDTKQLEAAWNARARFAAQWIPAGTRVLDIGCGVMALESFLPPGCEYQPCDVVPRDHRTIIADLNRDGVPKVAGEFDRITMLGVLEYLYEPSAVLRQLAETNRAVLMSYCVTDWTSHLDRRALGWVNDFSLSALKDLFRETGWHIRRQDKVDSVQMLFLLEPPVSKIPPQKRALVLSYANAGNFGDRLGYHLVHSVLPPHVEVTHAFFKPWSIPEGDFDILVLGIGNSLFGPLLTQDLLRLMDRIPRKIGIFGTQYREQLPLAMLSGVLDRLDHWYARYEEDVLLYGRGRNNVSHLGDWLVHAFPMARGRNEGMLKIGNEIWKDLPLDRTIQSIQQHRQVFSTRLHPLLCALTSADEVAYQEQREGGTTEKSGKFRSLLIDVFGRDFPEEVFWKVDREAVTAYKVGVARRLAELSQRMDRLLTD